MKRILLILLLLVSFGFGQFSNVSSLEHDNVLGIVTYVGKIGAAHTFLTYQSSDAILRCKIFSYNTSTWAITQETTHWLGINALSTQAKFVVIDSTHVILAYEGTDTDGWIKTVSVSTDKATITDLDSLEHQGDQAWGHQIEKIDDTHFFVAYTKSTAPAVIMAKVFSIDGSYNITEGDSLQINNAYAVGMSMTRNETNNRYIVNYSTTANYSTTKLLSVNGSYEISILDTIKTAYIHNGNSALTSVNDTTYIAAINDNDGSSIDLKTYHINPSTYELSLIDSIRTGATSIDNADVTDMIEWDSGDIIPTWNDTDGDGWLRSYKLDESYDITQQDDAFEYTTNSHSSVSMHQLNDSLFVMGLSKYGSDGEIAVKKFFPVADGWAHSILGIQSPTKINSAETFTKVSGVE